MKYLSSAAILLAGSISSVSVYAKPLTTNGECQVAIQGSNKQLTAGALYFINNDPKGNFIVTHDILKDGTVSFSRGTYAGGRGAHGDDSPAANGPDALFSQGAIKVGGDNLFTVNAGSNTMTMFAIDKQQPSNLTQIGDPTSTGGDFPMSIAVSPKNDKVCVANSGQNDGVLCFSVDNKNGLNEIQNTRRPLNLGQSTPPKGPGNTVSHVIFSEDGTKLIASVKGTPPNKAGFLATWDIDPKTNALSQNFQKSTPNKPGLLPFSMTVIKGKNAILNTDAATGFGVYNFNTNAKSKDAAQRDVASNVITPIKGQGATCWSSFSGKSGSFFLTDIGTSTVTEVTVDNNLKASIVKQYPQKAGSATIDNEVANINGQDFLYVLAANATTIDVLNVGNKAGTAKNVQQFNFLAAAKKAGLKVNPNNVQGMTAFAKAF